MGSQALTSNDRSRTYWTPTMERYFIDLMLDQVQRGNRVGHTFNKQAWVDMLTMFNAKFGTKYDKDVLKGRYKNLWEQYNDVKILLEQSGFSWDELRQMVTATEYDWDCYIKTHPDVGSYKNKPVLNFSDLCVIYGYTTADGRYSFSSHDVDLDDDIPGVKIGEGMVSQTPTNVDRSRTYWTPTMDRFFVDLMLDQVNRGNKIDHTFNKQAWTEMIVLFNEKFESKHNKNVLRSRYKILRKHYSDMKVLLSQSGFALDESRQMVIADDSVWDAYTKAHPDTRSCRTTTVPDFNDLYMIYGDEIADGRKLRSVHDVDLDDDIPGMKIGEGKDTQTPSSCDRSRTYWTPPMDRYLIDLLLDQVHKGNKIDNTFIAHAWTDMTELFNAKFRSQHDKDVLKNRYKSLRKQHNDIKVLLDQSGFAWDETRQMVRADDNVWDAYIKAHPDARSYRVKIVPHYNELCAICGSSATHGRYSRLDHGIDHEYDILEVRIGEDMDSQEDPISCGSSVTYWTPPMDRYFIDLMIAQMHKGDKIAHTFNKESWLVMTTLFNAKFGSQHEEDALRNRYKNLWKQYNDVRFLLEQSGFSWDESQQMIIADDDIWDTYIQAYPDVQSYKTTTVPSYSDLCLIYGNSNDDGRNSCRNDDADLNDDVTRFMVGEGMDSQAPTICDGSRTYWTPSMDRHFIDLMMDQVHKGNKIDHTFTKQAWTNMVALFNAQFGSQHDKDVLRSRYKNLRKQYNDIKILLDHGGFAWNETRQMVTADDDAWDAYLKVHPDARSYINKTVPDYNSLRVIYGNEIANRKNIHSGGNSELNNDIATTKAGKGNEVFTNCDRSRTYWTPPMDRYFIDLMLQQVHRGNKIDHTFNKQAWTHMITLFNVKFGSQYDKDVLKSRYKNLRKQYNSVKILLNQDGFGWDETRQMVTADDDVWDDYIQAHPDAQSYRTKILANYNDLCVIFGNGITDGRDIHYDHDVDLDSIDGVSGGLQSSATSISLRETMNDLESTPHSGKDVVVISNQQKKRQSVASSASQNSRKVRKRTKNGMVDALSEMTEVITSLANKNKNNGNSISVENVMNALQAVPDIDEELILDACDLLEDEKKAKTFLALDVTLRKKWLMRKLRP